MEYFWTVTEGKVCHRALALFARGAGLLLKKEAIDDHFDWAREILTNIVKKGRIIWHTFTELLDFKLSRYDFSKVSGRCSALLHRQTKPKKHGGAIILQTAVKKALFAIHLL